MNSFRKTCAGALALIFGATSIVPTVAAPMNMDRPAINQNMIQARAHYRPQNYNRGHRPGYWHGHRGYRHYRHGYRRHNDGWWYPLAAFGAGAIIGGAISQPRPVYRAPAGSPHVQCAIAAISPIGHQTIHSSPITGHASSAVRLILVNYSINQKSAHGGAFFFYSGGLIPTFASLCSSVEQMFGIIPLASICISSQQYEAVLARKCAIAARK